MDRLPGYPSLFSRIEHKKAQVKSQLPTEHCHLVDEFAVYVLEQVNKCLYDVPTASQDEDGLGSNGTVARALTSDVPIETEQTNPADVPSSEDNNNREESITSEQTVSRAAALSAEAHSETIHANIKVEVEDVSPEQSVQFGDCVKKEEEKGGVYVMECDCKECEICRVKMEMKEELNESGETELGVNSGLAVQGCTRVKKEEEDGNDERPNKIQRMGRVVGNGPVQSPSPNVISINVKYIEGTSSTNPITIEDQSQPDTIALPTPIVTSVSAQHEMPLGDELLNGEPIIDHAALVVSVDAQKFDREQVDQDNSSLIRVPIDQDDEEEDEEESEQTIENRENPSVDDERSQVQEPAENFVKQIEPDELGNRFECDYRGCAKRMKLKTNLICHIRSHTGEKPFSCSVAGCDRTFSQKGQLGVHLRTHTGERPFKCDQCDGTFIQSGHLVAHQRIHTGVRPFGCTWPDCGKAFISSGELKKHSSAHSNEHAFVCDVHRCRKAFKSRSALRKHQRTKHI